MAATTPQLEKVPPSLAKPDGDPGAMERMAGACRSGADQISDSANTALQAVNGMNFTAPAASRIRGRIRGNSWGQSTTADALRTFAQHLEDGARKLRSEIKAYEDRETLRTQIEARNRRAIEQSKNPLGLGTPGIF